MNKTILVTGGTGYIGSHIVVELTAAGYHPVIIDNLTNSDRSVIDRIAKITQKVSPPFHQIDLLDPAALDQVFSTHTPSAVIHLAAKKAVGESVAKPLEYYRNNLVGTLNLLDCMIRHQVKNLIFSSSATVYGTPQHLPLTETSPVGIGITNPYGRTKFFIEQIIADLVVAHPDFSATNLRYFNPIGAHESGLIGESPRGTPNNIVPFIARVAEGHLPKVQVYGDDYDTADGTGIRDYIHVVDLATGHLAALRRATPGVATYNLGTGTGTSVLELIHLYQTTSGRPIPYTVVKRRPGDIAAAYTSVDLAKQKLGWTAQKTVATALTDDWRWRQTETL